MAKRRLIIVRHAKSSWDDPTLDDHDRPLSRRGQRALPVLAEHLRSISAAPDVVLCSTSARTIATLDGIKPALPPDAEIVIDERLFHAGEHWMLDQIRSLPDAVGSVLVVGHNPGLQEMAIQLVGAGTADDRAQLERKFPTAAAATIVFDGTWGDVAAGVGHLEHLFLPRPPGS